LYLCRKGTVEKSTLQYLICGIYILGGKNDSGETTRVHFKLSQYGFSRRVGCSNRLKFILQNGTDTLNEKCKIQRFVSNSMGVKNRDFIRYRMPGYFS
jgi:hypothetical protein